MSLFGSKREAAPVCYGVKVCFTDTSSETFELRRRIIARITQTQGMRPNTPDVINGWLCFDFKRNLPEDLQQQALRSIKAVAANEAGKEGISSIALIETF